MMKPGIGLRAALLACAALLAACATTPAPVSNERIAGILASPDRRPADRTNDVRRKPAELLAVVAPRPGIFVLDLVGANTARR